MSSSEISPPEAEIPETETSGGRASLLVGAGILLSRISGLVRQRVFAQFFGTSLYADAFNAGLRIPNAVQNLLGEGTLSASFIPVYAELLERGRREEAGLVAGAIFALLFALAGVLTLVGVLMAPLLTTLIVPGYEEERRAVTITIMRILFPMTGLLVLSAWALGILNSHRRFFVSYVAPVIWNGAMISVMLVLGGRTTPDELVVALAWGAMIGGALQFAVQLPWVLRLERELDIAWAPRLAGVREAVSNAGPAILGRGVVQLSAYVDMFLASLLAIGAVAAIGYAQVLYLLPISLFGMSVAAAELPELSRQRQSEGDVLRERASVALQRMSFYVVPSVIAYLALGDIIVGALFQTGDFGRADTLLVYFTLSGYALGLLASTSTRLFSSTFYALRDTRTPARTAAIRVATAAVAGFFLMIQFEPIRLSSSLVIGPGPFGDVRVGTLALGAAGLTFGAGVAAWLEFFLLRRALASRIGQVAVAPGKLPRMFAAAIAGAAAGWLVRLALGGTHPIFDAFFILGAYGLTYFAVAAALGLAEAKAIFARVATLARRFF